ncbi:unnamed protein product [Brachionus calyciflorus]|uniref:KRAB-A domain-containing protein 2 n=1 Tax=Brachionus calyciflorus TaxID=104777 RepID=A0A814GTA9_9BILA|nr:unnamed protein product [Brachionus calyciflorus]
MFFSTSLEVGGINRLIKLDESENAITYVCPYEDLYDEIHQAHLKVGHGGVKITEKELKKIFSNISHRQISLFISFCCFCSEKNTKYGSKRVVVKPLISTEFMNRGQLDLMDFQTMPDGPFKWIMDYQDHHNKLSWLCALASKFAAEVARNLIDFLKHLKHIMFYRI